MSEDPVLFRVLLRKPPPQTGNVIPLFRKPRVNILTGMAEVYFEREDITRMGKGIRIKVRQGEVFDPYVH